MPRSLLLFFVLTLLVGAAPAAYAQSTCPAGQTQDAFGTCTADANAASAQQTAQSAAANTASGLNADGSLTTQQYQDAAAARAPTDNRQSTDDAYNGVMIKIMSLFAWLVGVAAITLDNAVYYTVVTMGNYVHNLTAVGITWRILRDLGNILLIFGFLAVGVTTILNVDWYGGGKKMLPMMFVAAVFLNFSLFISEAFIDVSNLFATQFYTQINGGQPAGVKGFDPGFTLSVSNEGISNKIMSQLGMQTIYGDAIKNKVVFEGGAPWFIGFMGIILFLITAFVLFSLAFVLIARFVILLFLIILSPAAFAGLAVPQLAKRAGQWWSTLFEQILTAPILLLMLYIALTVITDAQFLTGFGIDKNGPQWLGFINNGNLSGFAGMMLSFLVAMGLLMAVVIQSKNLSAFGASKASALAGKLTFGATAYGMSALGGGGAFGLRKTLQRFAPNNRAVRAVSNYALRPLERARFDMRSVGVGAALTAVGVGEAAAPIGASTVGRAKQGLEFIKKTGQEAERQYQQETVIPRLNTAVQTAMQTGDYRQISTILSSMSDKDFETSAAQRALIDNPIAAALLPQARFEKLQQSEVLSDARKAEIAAARRAGDDPSDARSRFNMAGPRFGPTLPGGAPHPFAGMTRGEALISGMNTATRGRLGGNVLTESPPAGAPAGTPPTPRRPVLDLLNGSDFDAIRRTGELTPVHRTAVGEYIEDVLAHMPPVPSPRQASIIAAAAAPAFRSYFNLP